MIKKNDMLTAIATKCEESGLKITKKDLDTVLKAQSDFLLETIAANEEVKIGDVMKVGGKHEDSKQRRNPATGETFMSKAYDGKPYAKFTACARAHS